MNNFLLSFRDKYKLNRVFVVFMYNLPIVNSGPDLLKLYL